MVELAYTVDLKSTALGIEGSNPSPGIGDLWINQNTK